MIIITGAGRSGTSALAGAMEGRGYPMAMRQELIAPNWSNTKGNYEPLSLKNFHEAILKQTTETFHDWDFFEFNGDTVPENARAEFDGLAARIGDSEVVKDPRFTFTLPMWRKRVNVEAVIYIFRNPDAVAQSLFRRDGVPEDVAMEFWLHWVRAFESHTAFSSVILVEYETLVSSQERVLDMIADRLGGKKTASTEKQEGAASGAPTTSGGFVDAGLNHYEARGKASQPETVRKVYANLREEAGLALRGIQSQRRQGEVSLLAEAEPMTASRRLKLRSRWIAGLTQEWRKSTDKDSLANMTTHINNLEQVVLNKEQHVANLLTQIHSLKSIVRGFTFAGKDPNSFLDGSPLPNFWENMTDHVFLSGLSFKSKKKLAMEFMEISPQLDLPAGKYVIEGEVTCRKGRLIFGVTDYNSGAWDIYMDFYPGVNHARRSFEIPVASTKCLIFAANNDTESEMDFHIGIVSLQLLTPESATEMAGYKEEVTQSAAHPFFEDNRVQMISHLNLQIDEMRNSVSWRITHPIREAKRIMVIAQRALPWNKKAQS